MEPTTELASGEGEGSAHAGPDASEDERKLARRESARRARLKKKNNFHSLAQENELLRSEVNKLRKQLQRTNVSGLVSSDAELIEATRLLIEQRLTNKICEMLTQSLQVRQEAHASVGRVISDLSNIIPAVAQLEVRSWFLSTWAQMKRSGANPADPLLHAIDESDGPHHQNMTMPQRETICRLVEGNSERLDRLRRGARTVRELTAAMQRLWSRLEPEGAWYLQSFAPEAIKSVSPEQAASFYRWWNAHSAAMHKRVTGAAPDAAAPQSKVDFVAPGYTRPPSGPPNPAAPAVPAPAPASSSHHPPPPPAPPAFHPGAFLAPAASPSPAPAPTPSPPVRRPTTGRPPPRRTASGRRRRRGRGRRRGAGAAAVGPWAGHRCDPEHGAGGGPARGGELPRAPRAPAAAPAAPLQPMPPPPPAGDPSAPSAPFSVLAYPTFLPPGPVFTGPPAFAVYSGGTAIPAAVLLSGAQAPAAPR
eukprot:tig00000545_g2003.t1